MIDLERIYTVTEAAEELNYTQRDVRRAIHEIGFVICHNPQQSLRVPKGKIEIQLAYNRWRRWLMTGRSVIRIYDHLIGKDVRQLYRVGIAMSQGQGEAEAETLVVVPPDWSHAKAKTVLTKQLSTEGSVRCTGKFISVGTVYVLSDRK